MTDLPQTPTSSTEVQPLGAGATADTPLPAPYCCRTDYPADHRDDGPQDAEEAAAILARYDQTAALVVNHGIELTD